MHAGNPRRGDTCWSIDPAHLHQHPVLRIHEVRLGSRDAEKTRVEGVHAVQETTEAHALLGAHALCSKSLQASVTGFPHHEAGVPRLSCTVLIYQHSYI